MEEVLVIYEGKEQMRPVESLERDDRGHWQANPVLRPGEYVERTVCGKIYVIQGPEPYPEQEETDRRWW